MNPSTVDTGARGETFEDKIDEDLMVVDKEDIASGVSIGAECENSSSPKKKPMKSLKSEIKDGFGEGKDLVVTVMSAMGEEQICALKDIGPK